MTLCRARYWETIAEKRLLENKQRLNKVQNAGSYAMISVCDAAGNVIETHNNQAI